MGKISFKQYFVDRLKTGKLLDVIIILYLLFCLSSGIYFIAIGSLRNVLMCFGFMVLPLVVYILEYVLHIQIPIILVIGAFFLGIGSILGACFNLYTIIPVFDSILHTVSGFLFGCFGFALMRYFIGDINTTKKVVGCIFMGFVFSLAVANAWELIEYAGSAITENDMQEDTIVREFNTYLLSGDHNTITAVQDITKTVIYYGDNQVITIDGYIDLGLIDTLTDSLVCCIGAFIYVIIISISYGTKKYIFRLCVPKDWKYSNQDIIG